MKFYNFVQPNIQVLSEEAESHINVLTMVNSNLKILV